MKKYPTEEKFDSNDEKLFSERQKRLKKFETKIPAKDLHQKAVINFISTGSKIILFMRNRGQVNNQLNLQTKNSKYMERLQPHRNIWKNF